MLIGIIGWIVLGLIAGALAKAIMPGNDPGGILLTMLLGVVGALLGGFLGSAIFGVGLKEFWSIQTWLVAIIGSVIVLAIYRVIAGHRAVQFSGPSTYARVDRRGIRAGSVPIPRAPAFGQRQPRHSNTPWARNWSPIAR